VNLGVESRNKTIVAAVLGVVAVLIIGYQFVPSSSPATPAPTPATELQVASTSSPRPAARRGSGSKSAKKERAPQSLDPTLHLQQLAATEEIRYEGSGRNIFVSQADPVIPTPQGNGSTDKKADERMFQPAAVTPPPPIPLKFFGFASHPGEAKKIFLSKGDDVFIAGEGEIVDRRYKVLRISATSVEIQDVVSSGPPQSIPLTQG
jgi:hypothetical protein